MKQAGKNASGCKYARLILSLPDILSTEMGKAEFYTSFINSIVAIAFYTS